MINVWGDGGGGGQCADYRSNKGAAYFACVFSGPRNLFTVKNSLTTFQRFTSTTRTIFYKIRATISAEDKSGLWFTRLLTGYFSSRWDRGKKKLSLSCVHSVSLRWPLNRFCNFSQNTMNGKSFFLVVCWKITFNLGCTWILSRFWNKNDGHFVRNKIIGEHILVTVPR